MNDDVALIGHSGFVGKALDSARFSARFNSKNIGDATGRHFNEIVCAGVQAVKWWANKNPEADWAGIESLLKVLGTVTADRFVLISTVDVFKDSRGADETTPIDTENLHAYGLHRHKVEEFVRDRYGASSVVVRLPGLFGPGLKKNLVFDLLEARDVSGFNPASSFQFYGTGRLANDLEIVGAAGINTVHMAVEPVSVAQVAEALHATEAEFSTDATIVNYDLHTIHAQLWQSDGCYVEAATDCLAALSEFKGNWRSE